MIVSIIMAIIYSMFIKQLSVMRLNLWMGKILQACFTRKDLASNKNIPYRKMAALSAWEA